MQAALARRNLISLAAGFTDTETLPVRETRALLGELLRSNRAGRAALQYGSTPGDPALRRLTAERLARLDGQRAGPRTAWSPERMLITIEYRVKATHDRRSLVFPFYRIPGE